MISSIYASNILINCRTAILNRKRPVVLVLLLSCLIGCDYDLGGIDGSGDIINEDEVIVQTQPDSTTRTVSFGPVTKVTLDDSTGKRTLTVNTTTVDSDEAEVFINDQSNELDQLDLGDYVVVDSLTANKDVNTKVIYRSSVVGPAKNINAFSKKLEILGQDIVIGDKTVFGEGYETTSFWDTIKFDDILCISGAISFVDDQRVVNATRVDLVEKTVVGLPLSLVGEINNLNQESLKFSIGDQVITYDNAIIEGDERLFIEGANVAIYHDQGLSLVDQEKSIANKKVFNATRIVIIADRLGFLDNNTSSDLYGIVSHVSPQGTFRVNGILVSLNPETQFNSGNRADIQNGRRIFLEGKTFEKGDEFAINAVTISVYPVEERIILRGILEKIYKSDNPFNARLRVENNRFGAEKIEYDVHVDNFTMYKQKDNYSDSGVNSSPNNVNVLVRIDASLGASSFDKPEDLILRANVVQFQPEYANEIFQETCFYNNVVVAPSRCFLEDSGEVTRIEKYKEGYLINLSTLRPLYIDKTTLFQQGYSLSNIDQLIGKKVKVSIRQQNELYYAAELEVIISDQE